MDILLPKVSDLGNFKVLRVLPTSNPKRYTVGPFIFWDQMGPGEFLKDQGLDVRPHPHIGLETITYLFDGRVTHKDSLGSNQIITPGDVNIMCAGRGIVHSERTPFEDRTRDSRLFGIQAWLVLPTAREQTQPTFTHHAQDALPLIQEKGVHARLILGEAFGRASPAFTHSKSIYMDVHMEAEAAFVLPSLGEEMGIYLLEGDLSINAQALTPTHMALLPEGEEVRLTSRTPARFMVLGGEATQGERFMWWNFVSSDKACLAQAAIDWQEGRFAGVSGDSEYIPLPHVPRSCDPDACS